MEVSRRRVLQRHLEPARPLRRCIQVDIEKEGKTQRTPEIISSYILIALSFFPSCHLHFLTGRISYTRDFLIGLACCPEAKRKPEFLPEHPIVLPKAVNSLFYLSYVNSDS
uniref:Uncharacterized protein n=1 Tax=Sphaeramia orbicularis TaxID=375764 RepID=A0A672Y6C9_9TELE